MTYAPRRRRYDAATLEVLEHLLAEFAERFPAGVVLRAVETARNAAPSAGARTIELLARQDLEHRATRRPRRR